jgi:geranylgeranyl reductase family protein
MSQQEEHGSRNRSKDWDVIVVGAGPAGSTAAFHLATAGARVLVIERRRRVGVPVFCAEHIPLSLTREIYIPSPCIAQRIEGMETHINGEVVARGANPALMIYRDVFDQLLAQRAVDAGAELHTMCRVVSMEEGGVRFVRDGRVHCEYAAFVIGADGPLSRVGRSMGMVNSTFVHAVQVEVPLVAPMNRCQVHFLEEWRGGYGWVFPKGDSANVGVGVRRPAGGPLTELLSSFLGSLLKRGILRGGRPLGRTGGLIPVGGPLERTACGNALLVGDAAGHTHPITGAGVVSAVTGGRLAAQCVLEAIGRGRRHLLRYEELWRDEFGAYLERGVRRRKEMEGMWGRLPLHRVISRCWVAFQEYYR